MNRTLFAYLFSFFALPCAAQTITLEPNRSLFAQLLADAKEPRIAALVNQNNNELSLDIGASLDLVQISFEQTQVGFGVDFGTFSELRREWNFKFPVNAADYIFGINMSYRSPLTKSLDLTGRFRALAYFRTFGRRAVCRRRLVRRTCAVCVQPRVYCTDGRMFRRVWARVFWL
jgi:hypothetical protein